MTFDLVVVGGGHAGVEAAYIASKKNLSVLLVTSHLDLIAQMSCNPAIGGIAKGNITREIDALGGLMGTAIDFAGIHFKMLNKSKGMAVWGPRAQADKSRYRAFVRRALEKRETLSLLQAKVTAIITDGDRVDGVVLDCGEKIKCRAVVLAMGTFLNGVGHIGMTSFPCGRGGEAPSLLLTESLGELGIRSGRLKTGTSPRIDGRTVDFSRMTEQLGDASPQPFSFTGCSPVVNSVSCWATRSTAQTHAIIRDNLDRSPLYAGKIKSIGPRYCPSIEDKVVRFGERDGHTLFLEPEGVDCREMYLNGLSTSLPFDIQKRMVESIPGLEHARILRPGYGIEYDYFQPMQLKATLESGIVRNLFFAGQINGTSGYEEAACQGLAAGINAASNLTDGEPFVLGRELSYTGVLIDDLVTRGTEEPYRMFTSRAEYRLALRQDNADERLMPMAHARGFVDDETFEARRRIWDSKEALHETLGNRRITPLMAQVAGSEVPSQTTKVSDYLRRPEVDFTTIEKIFGELDECADVKLRFEADIKYRGFVEKQAREIKQARAMDLALIPEGFDFASVPGLPAEARQKFTMVRPSTVGQASRIPGVTPADMSVLLTHLARTT